MKWLTENWSDLLPAPWSAVALVIVAVLCGAIVGIERDKKEKPVGFRTLTLVSLGAAVFTMMSSALANTPGESSRIAAQVVTGIGFLGAGVILRGPFGVTGLTSAATIWAMAATGMVVGAGYAGAGLALSVLILAVITSIAALEQQYVGPCDYVVCVIAFASDGGKTAVRIEEILDEYHVPSRDREMLTGEGNDERLRLRYCHVHKHHREFLSRLAEMPNVCEIRRNEHAS